MEKLNVGIADDNELIVSLLSDIVAQDEELRVVGTARNGEEAYQMIKTKQPDVVLLDIIMPEMDGLAVMDKRKRGYHRRCVSDGSILLHNETFRERCGRKQNKNDQTS